jgi:hypothetical protein
MSKKRFSEGLDDLFSDSKSSVGSLFSNDVAATVPAPERRSGHKNFMSDLDSLLQDALDESLEKFESGRSDNTLPSNKSKSNARTSADNLPHGLDALLRQTIDIQEIIND